MQFVLSPIYSSKFNRVSIKCFSNFPLRATIQSGSPSKRSSIALATRAYLYNLANLLKRTFILKRYSSISNFNPRSHTGSDYPDGSWHSWCDRISIHAPTRGATLAPNPSSASTVFQSTLPHGERHDTTLHTHHNNYISIHAPTRGATT